MPKRRTNMESVTKENINQQSEECDMILPMMESMLEEIKTLSTKKHDAKLSSLKVKMIYRLISTARKLLANQPVFVYLEEINEQDLPEYSDVSIILRQYIEALEQFKLQDQDNVSNLIQGHDLSILSEDDIRQLEQILSKAKTTPSV